MELKNLTIKQANEGFQKKEFSSVELTTAYLDNIKKTDEKVNAYITVTKDIALAQAKKADEQSDFAQPLSGIPVGIKDLFCIKGVKTTAGSKILENYIPSFSASAVEKLEAQNSVMLGKLNLDEFAMGGSGENSAFGATKNPWDLTRVPGGSSAGSAAAVAADECVYALGTDTGGSVRQPAGFCGCVGLKVTYGRVSRYGVTSYASSFDTIGPLTKTVEDSALVLNTIAGKDPKDATTPDITVPDYTVELTKDIKDLKIGIPKQYFAEGLNKNVEKIVREAVAKLEELGAKVVEVDLPLTKYAIATYYLLVKSEASSNMSRYDGVRYGASANRPSLMENYKETRKAGFGPEVKRSIMLGTYALSAGYYDAYYNKAAQMRTLFKQEFEKVLSEVDCLVTPVSPTVAFKLGDKNQDPLTMYLADIFTVPMSIAGVPALSLPCGFAKPDDGDIELPVGMQIIGKQFDEATILRVGYNYEQATDWCKKKPNIS